MHLYIHTEIDRWMQRRRIADWLDYLYIIIYVGDCKIPQNVNIANVFGFFFACVSSLRETEIHSTNDRNRPFGYTYPGVLRLSSRLTRTKGSTRRKKKSAKTTSFDFTVICRQERYYCVALRCLHDHIICGLTRTCLHDHIICGLTLPTYDVVRVNP